MSCEKMELGPFSVGVDPNSLAITVGTEHKSYHEGSMALQRLRDFLKEHGIDCSGLMTGRAVVHPGDSLGNRIEITPEEIKIVFGARGPGSTQVVVTFSEKSQDRRGVAVWGRLEAQEII